MQIEIKDVNQCVKELTITVPAEETKKDYMSVINKFKNYVVVPGYRKGKAPTSMVTSMYSERVKDTYLSEKLGDYYKKAVESKDLKPLYDPEVIDVKWEPNEDLVAVFRYEIEPQVEIKKYTGLEIEFEPTAFEEKMIDDTIEDIRKKNARFDNSVTEVNEECSLFIDGEFTDSEAKEELPQDLKFLNLTENKYGDKLKNDLLGKKKGDTVETTVTLEENKERPIKVEIKEIMKIILPEIDEEFIKKEGFDSVEEFRKTIEEDIKKNVDDSNRKNQQMAVNMALIEENPFDISPSAAMEYAKSMVQPYAEYYNKPVEELAQQYVGMAVYEMKSYYMEKELLKAVPLEISEQDEQDMIEQTASELNLSKDEYIEKNPDVTKQEEFVQKMKKEKLFNYLCENNSFVPYKKKEKEAVTETEEEENKE